MKFGKAQQLRFGTYKGAYSLVTDREHYDSQITLTDYEAELLISHFGIGNLHVGNVQSNQDLASKPFRLFPGGESINLNVVFPKPEKSELRLYLSTKSGFKPDGGKIWFTFIKGTELWIGAMSEYAWRLESSLLKDDLSDSLYQESLDETDDIRISRLKERDSYARDRTIAIDKMKLSGFSCEFDKKHNLFISRFTGQPYVEAHHLIPMGLQRDFPTPLDTIHNVFCLCPQCHRAVHHAEKSVAREILDSLADKGPILEEFNLTIDDLFALYAIEEIE